MTTSALNVRSYAEEQWVDPRLDRILAEAHLLLEMFADSVRTSTGRRSPLIESVMKDIDEYRADDDGASP